MQDSAVEALPPVLAQRSLQHDLGRLPTSLCG